MELRYMKKGFIVLLVVSLLMMTLKYYLMQLHFEITYFNTLFDYQYFAKSDLNSSEFSADKLTIHSNTIKDTTPIISKCGYDVIC